MQKFRPKFVRTAGKPPPLFSGVLRRAKCKSGHSVDHNLRNGPPHKMTHRGIAQAATGLGGGVLGLGKYRRDLPSAPALTR